MPTRLAILGLDTHQRCWLQAVLDLRSAGDIELTAIGHRSAAAAKDTADAIKTLAETKTPAPAALPTFDDLRLVLKDQPPQILLIDRPANASLDFLLACIHSGIAIFSLGPLVETLAEAQSFAAALGPRSNLFYSFPSFLDSPAFLQCAQAEEFIRPIRFAAATWLGANPSIRRPAADEPPEFSVRSLSVLAWDAIATLIRLLGVPATIYTAIRGTTGSAGSFADLSGAASVTMRFADDAAASLTLCDRVPDPDIGRQLLLWGANGSLAIRDHAYKYRDAAGTLIDDHTHTPPKSELPAPRETALKMLRDFLRHVAMPPSPHTGWEHRLEDIAATMEALVVSHRTGQAESPEKFRKLRR